MSLLKSAVHKATGSHTASVIWLHGLGDSSSGWDFLAQQFKSMKHIKWIFPNAPFQPVTINGGMPCPSWYDIYALGADVDSPNYKDRADEKGLLSSVRSINEIIQSEIDGGIPSNRILVGGFSQGSVVSLLTGLTSERSLAGIAALSGYLAMADKLPSMITDRGRQLPVFWGHGREDEVVRFSWGDRSAKTLQNDLKVKVEFHAYNGMGHSASLEELDDLRAWMEKILPAESAKI